MKDDEKGFSLVEILLAVSIIGVVAAAALPKAAHVLAVSRTQRVVSDLQTLDAAVVMYETEHGTQPTGINDLSDYIQNIKNVKPPKGSMVIRGSSTEEVKDGDYKLTKPDNKDIRATLDAHPAEDYMAGGTK
ncbi:prepilin-type N-terminal cleavage/methylation domain-containing protein [uncultured Selenomonas sp.]|uniref:type II secretion system protein n=1 Tax=uncultured Selenomonas sp. TaxID=159275 RepID=UPI0025F02D9F|nr:prepilin-type N-terminal cleavage/methylation domain-containing protein [uncultured Selenomonas sp.]